MKAKEHRFHFLQGRIRAPIHQPFPQFFERTRGHRYFGRRVRQNDSDMEVTGFPMNQRRFGDQRGPGRQDIVSSPIGNQLEGLVFTQLMDQAIGILIQVAHAALNAADDELQLFDSHAPTLCAKEGEEFTHPVIPEEMLGDHPGM